MVEHDSEVPSRIRKVKGGFLKVQGTWIPHDRALALARKIAWPIREELIPLFGPDFPSTCLSPTDPGYGEVTEKGRRNRRHAHSIPAPSSAASGTQPSPSGAPASQGQGQPWITSSPPIPRRATIPSTAPEPTTSGSRPSGYSVGSSASPRGSQSAIHPGSPHVQGQYPSYLGGHPQAGQRYPQASQTPSPTHTVREEYATEAQYTSEPGYYAPPQTYAPYPSGYGATASPPTYPNTTNVYQGSSQNQAYGAHQQHQVKQEYSQPTTPTRTAYSSSEPETYASNGVSLDQGQPCDTYPQAHYQHHAEEYAPHYQSQHSSTYQQYHQQQVTRAPHQAPYTYGPAESNVRYESGYGAEPVASSSRSTATEYSHPYGSGSAGGQDVQGHRTYHQQAGQYAGAEYQAAAAPQQQQAYTGGYSYQQPQYPNQSYNA